MTTHALLFELDSIQSWLFASGRLRDVAGASELVDRLTEGAGNLLDAVCDAAGVSGRIKFSRRAGGAVYAFGSEQEALEDLRDLWTLAVQQRAPGLAYSIGLGAGATAQEAFRAARDALRADSSRLRPRLPAAAPPAERARRTGLAAEYPDRKEGLVDASIHHRKRFADPAEAGFLDRYSPGEAGLGWRDWPRNLEDGGDSGGGFPFRGERRAIALVHADGNGLGQVLRSLDEAAEKQPKRFVALYRRFSELVAGVTQEAAQAATREILLPAREEEGSTCVAARPILLGGDDVIMLVRADLALDYIRVFARVFEQASRRKLAALADEGIKDLPERLTLGFGVVYLRASQPFHLAVQLADSLMKEAKRVAKSRNRLDPPASVALHRVTGSLVDDYEALVERQFTHVHDGEWFIDTLGVYFLDDESRPALSDLDALAALLAEEGMARGPLRQLLTLIGHGEAPARQRYRRWRLLMGDNRKQQLDQFDELLQKLVGDRVHDELPYARGDGRSWRSPLGDALALLGAGVARRVVDGGRRLEEVA